MEKSASHDSQSHISDIDTQTQFPYTRHLKKAVLIRCEPRSIPKLKKCRDFRDFLLDPGTKESYPGNTRHGQRLLFRRVGTSTEQVRQRPFYQ